jgi:hypothetical protein
MHRPPDLVAGADYRAVDINGQPPQTQLPNLVVEQLTIDPHQRPKRGLREFLQPLHYGPIRRNTRQPAQPGEERIVRDIAQLLKSPRSNHQTTRRPRPPNAHSRSRHRGRAHEIPDECDDSD